jgi:hypothetical protein
MTKKHCEIEDEFSAAGLTFEEVKRHFRNYVYHLELVAASLEKDRARSAYYSINLTIKLLQIIGVRGPAYAPLIEAVRIINDGHWAPLDFERVYRAIALKLQLEAGTREAAALKNIVGDDTEAVKNLKNFTKAMLRKDSRYPSERELYDDLRHKFKVFPPDEALKMLLSICRAIRGKKV